MATRLKKWPTTGQNKPAQAEKPAPAEKTEQATEPAPKKKYTFLKAKD